MGDPRSLRFFKGFDALQHQAQIKHVVFRQ